VHSALDEGEWSASRYDRFYPQGTPPSTHWAGGWMGFRSGLDTEARENYLHLPGIEARSTSLQSDTILTELSQMEIIQGNKYLL
jgi:hypothetical protein